MACRLTWEFQAVADAPLTIDAFNPQAPIPEYKSCAVNVTPVSEEELPFPEVQLVSGRY